MNNYVRKLFGVMFQSKQTQQIVQAKGFLWRTEPEIDAKRREELSML